MNKNDFGFGKISRHMIFLVTYAIVLVMLLINMNTTITLLGWIWNVLSPFIIGSILAFIINIIMSRLENNVFSFLNGPKHKIWNKIKRVVCLVLSFLIIILILAAIVFLIGPHILESISLLSKNIPGYVSYLQNFTNGIIAFCNNMGVDFSAFTLNWSVVFEKISSFIAKVSPNVFSIATGFTSAVLNFFMGVIFAVYILLSKENLAKNVKKLMRAYMPENHMTTTLSVLHEANSIFTHFVVGQLLEAVILGVMYFIGTSIFSMPYSPLIAVIMAIGGIIPMFGPIIGAIPCTFILLMINPKYALIFVIMAVVFQQVEGNIIYPKVVGTSIGLPGLWVLIAILVGGSIGGAFGMVAAVPVASLCYSLLRKDANKRIAAKEKQQSEQKSK